MNLELYFMRNLQRWASLPKLGNRHRYLPQLELLKAQSQLRTYFADLRTATRNSATPQLRYRYELRSILLIEKLEGRRPSVLELEGQAPPRPLPPPVSGPCK